MIGLKTRILYGTGGAVYAVKEAAFSTFVLLFYTQVLGLSGSVTGLVLSAALVWDGLTDPLVGSWSDRLQSKYGRRHPFIALSVVPLGLGFIGLFSPPVDVIENTTWLTCWLLFWTLWIRTFLTTFAIPHLALSGDISTDYQERNKVMGARMIFIFLFSLLLPAVGLLLIFPADGDIDGRFVVANYPIYGLLSCAVVWVMGLTVTLGTRQHITSSLPLPGAAAQQPLGWKTLVSDLLRTLKNKTFRNLLKYEVSAMIAWGTMSALNILAWTYYWEFDATEVSLVLSLPSLLAIGLVMFTLGPLSKRFEKQQQLKYSLIGMILDLLWLYPLKMFGFLPEDSPGVDFFLNFIFMVVFIYCYLFRAISSYSIISDISDEHEWNYGVRQEAGFFSVMNFIAKFSLVIGPIYAGIALDLIDLKQGVLPGNVPLETQNGLVYAMGIGVFPALLMAVYFVGRLKLGRAQVEDYQEKLKDRSERPAEA